mmetsp:Transcript_48024/g.139090  ORF Transcript_48024/g.139090 Transcript_48024/m.139090 type:complete len:390 (-) Transcript_48024:61-1230(-)
MQRKTALALAALLYTCTCSGLRLAGNELTGNDPASNWPLEPPRVLVSGIGDSGTTAVISALEQLGLVKCGATDFFNEPLKHHSWTLGMRETIISTFLQASGANMTKAGYQKAGLEWKLAGRFMASVAREQAICIRMQQKVDLSTVAWGYKEPHYIYLLPVINEVFGKGTENVVVARDPRDICTNDMQDQMLFYAKYFVHGFRFNSMDDCFTWWGNVWQQILDVHEKEPNFHIVRIEDLVVPQPSSKKAQSVLGCLLKHSGLKPDFTYLEAILQNMTNFLQDSDRSSFLSLSSSKEGSLYLSALQEDQAEGRPKGVVSKDEALKQLGGFHSHNNSYQGHHRHLTEAHRQNLEELVRNHREPKTLHRSMTRLGYHTQSFGLVEPHSPSVCV